MDAILFRPGNGIAGGSVHAGYEGWIELLSLEHGFSQPDVRPGAGAGSNKPEFTDLTLSKALDAASTGLYLAMLQGETLGRSEIVFAQTTEEGLYPTLTLTLLDAAIRSFEISAVPETAPLEILKLRFSALIWDYAGGDAPEGTHASWSLNRNKPVMADLLG